MFLILSFKTNMKIESALILTLSLQKKSFVINFQILTSKKAKSPDNRRSSAAHVRRCMYFVFISTFINKV